MILQSLIGDTVKKLFILSLIMLTFLGCENINTTLPVPDVTQFETNTNYIFPKGTTALELYTSLKEKASLTGSAKLVSGTTLNDFFYYSDTQVREISRFEVFSEKKEISYAYTVAFYFNYNGIESTDFNYEQNKNLPELQKIIKDAVFTYEWQHSVDNVWKNTKLQYEIILKKN